MRTADYMGVLFRSGLVKFASKDEMMSTDNKIIRQFLAGRAKGPIGMDEMSDDDETGIEAELEEQEEERLAQEKLEQQKKAAKIDRLPKLNLFAQGVYDNPNQRIFPAEDKFTFTWAAGASVTWSLNDYLNAGPHDAKWDAQLHALDADRKSLELGVRAQVTAARQAVVLSDRAYEATQRGLAAAEESHRVRQELLAAERATAIELIDADTELTRARIAAIDALIDRRIARARPANVIGEDQ
jgi:outer membrane protein TolC